MTTFLRRLSPLLALAAVLVLVLPTAAQQRPGDPAKPTLARSPELCVPAGTALAVLTSDATVAKIIGAPARATSNTAADGRTIVLENPGVVGACGQFQGYWSDGVSGAAGASLALYETDTTGSPLGGDRYGVEKTGPAIDGKPLKASTRVEVPGTHTFVAVFSVHAGGATSNAGVTDSARVPFTVVLRGRGTISGTVKDTNGAPLAGVNVRANPRTASGRFGGGSVPNPNEERPISEAIDGGAPDQNGRLPGNSAVTAADGTYSIGVAAGDYTVAAEGRGYKPQWYNLKDSARDADKVTVAENATAGGIDFVLAAGRSNPEPRATAQPAPSGKITGYVRDAAGVAIAGAQVAVGANTAGGLISIGDPAGRRSVVVTNDQGYYELTVNAGKWLVTASAANYKAQWYNLKDNVADADKVEVAADATVADINFALAALPHATLTGVVTNADGSPAVKAMVMAVNRAPQSNPRPGGDPATSIRGPVVFTDENGAYTLVVPPGTWAVGAGMVRNPQGSTAGLPSVWWDRKDKIDDADILTLVDGDTRDGISFQLK